MPAVNDVGEPCAGNRTHGSKRRELETEHPGHGHGSGTTGRETTGTQRLPDLHPERATAPAPDPTSGGLS